jgi:hypothetical protein
VAVLPPEATVDMDEATMEFITGPGAILLNLVGVLVNIIFGALGGLIGGAIFRPKTPAAPAAPAVPTV